MFVHENGGSMEEIDLKDLLSYFWSKKVIILVMFLLGLVIGEVYTAAIQKPLYQSYTTILLTKASDSTITSNDVTLNRNLVDTYREIIKSKKVLNKVINNLELDYDYAALNRKVGVTSINDTEIIKITVVDKDSKEASDIANEIANVFNAEVVKLYDIQNVGIVDVAEETDTPYNVNLVKQLVIASLIGLILGFTLVFVIYYFDTTIKSADKIEEKLGLPVIGIIPEVRGGKNE